ncbi:MAG TPA: dinitrogenase iron-molybdenum cofactor [Candidatus Aenigmarchaeota archaeon]|nr:dinitrogenase iron-molybdenum cofactor [Candidatus Aenigmarchaeota archaeon]
MKIAIASTGKELESNVSLVFGRAPYFLIVEVEGNEIKNYKVIENPAVNAMGGAGIQAAQLIANEGVEVVIAGNIGPNALNVLQQVGIKVVSMPNLKVKDAIEKFLKGEVPAPQFPTPGIRPGMGRGFGGPKECVCPVCGFRVPHQRGIPCAQHVCPKCGSRMVRG